MPPAKVEHLQDVAILTRAVENVFRKLVRFLVGRISLVKLQEMIRFIYVEESETKLRQERPNKDIPLTKQSAARNNILSPTFGCSSFIFFIL